MSLKQIIGGAVGSFFAMLAIAAPAGAAIERTIYRFNCGSTVGCVPADGLVAIGDMLYGSTTANGAYKGGAAFKISTSGALEVLHLWPSNASPFVAMINVGGTLYGTTRFGGRNNLGSIFKMSRSGAVTELASFNGINGEDPRASLVVSGGVLYGTTSSSDTHDGNAFMVTKAGALKVIYRFQGGARDGRQPVASLINVDGSLYGTTPRGGAHGEGTIFKIAPSGKEEIIHSFGSDKPVLDGADPRGGLVEVNGVLYGTTSAGGTFGNGTIFRIMTDGSERVLYNFNDRHGDGVGPQASMINYRGTLYGTTLYGGKAKHGTVFSITPEGVFTSLYSFKGADLSPAGTLVQVGGNLYGVTSGGGIGPFGTVYEVTP